MDNLAKKHVANGQMMLIYAWDTLSPGIKQHQQLAGDCNTGLDCHQLQCSSCTCGVQRFQVIFLCCSLTFLIMWAFGHK